MKIGLINKTTNFINLIIMAILWGCFPPPYSQVEDVKFKEQLNNLLTKADKLNKDEHLCFRMDTLTRFTWDKMYIFAGGVTSETMNNRLGVQWEYSKRFCEFWPDGNQLIVFVKDKKIVSSVYFIKGDKKYTDFVISSMGNYIPVVNSFFTISKHTYPTGEFILQINHSSEQHKNY
jgi:hypothetical protein